MTNLAHIADRVLNRPLLIHPTKAEVILSVLQGRIPIENASPTLPAPDASRFAGKASTSRTFSIEGGVAIVSIVGSLVNRGAWIGAHSGLTSYEGIAKQLSDAAADPAVHSIVLDLDSPGGEATGMFSVAAKVREIGAKKPVIAVVNDVAASAAFGIASQAREIVVSPTSMVGSIGVVLCHLDRSAEMAKKGVAATFIYAGAHKVDGHPFGPLSDTVKADLQTEIDQFYSQFIDLVAQGRGRRLSAAAARKTEARTFVGAEAIKIGLADRVASFDAVISQLKRNGRKTSGPKRSTTTMDYENDPALAAAYSAGEKAAFARINTILGSPKIVGDRVAVAIELASKAPGMSAEEVIDFTAKTVADNRTSPASLANREQPDPLGSAVDYRPNADAVQKGWAKAFSRADEKAAQRVTV